MSVLSHLGQIFSPHARASAQRRSLRHMRREQLHTVVREAMIGAGILSASYKFKVMALDPQADKLMVLIELAPQFGGQLESLIAIEQAIAQVAKDSYGIGVAAVYWRNNPRICIPSLQAPISSENQKPDVIDIGVQTSPPPQKQAQSGPTPLMGNSQYGDVT